MRALARAGRALHRRSRTWSREGGQRVAVFNPDEVVRALADFTAELDTVLGGGDGGGAGSAGDGGAGARERLYVPLAKARALLAKALQLDLVQRDQPLRFEASRPQLAARDLAGAERDLIRLVRDGYRVFVVFRHEGEAERATYRLRNLSAEVLSAEQLAKHGAAAPGLYFVAAPLRDGFLSAELKLAVVPERSLLRGAAREKRFTGGTRLATFFDVRPGDYVVHEDHGIARFAGIETRTVAGVTRDYLLLEYKGEDRVFVPHEQIGKVSRYIGAGAGAPALNKLGGTAWATVKTRARKAVVEMAGELLAALRRAPGDPRLRLPARRRADAAPRGGLPLRGDRGPGRDHRRRQERHGGAAPDGPPRLRRRRLRQDRGRRARRLQGRRGRQADPHARPDDDPRRAAPHDLRRALQRPAGEGRDGLALPHRRRAAADPRRVRQPARSTSSSAPTACSRPTCGPRTSAS